MNKIARVGDAASFRSSEVNDVQFTVQPRMLQLGKHASLGVNRESKVENTRTSLSLVSAGAAAVQGNTITLLERLMCKRQRGLNFDLDLAYSRGLY